MGRHEAAQCPADVGGGGGGTSVQSPLLSVASITSLSHVAMNKHLDAIGGPGGAQTLTQMALDIFRF